MICPIATPGITITGPNASCSAQTMHYVANPVNGGTTPAYSWKKNGITVGTNSPNFSTSGLIAGDQISCVLTSNQGCLTSTTATSNIITIVNAAAPIINSAAVTNNCNGLNNGAINLSVSGGTTPYNFAWDTTNTNGNIFVVTVGTETPANPNPPGIGVSFYVNGTETKELFLTRGIPYSFNVMGGHPFHLATLNLGALGTPNIVTNGQTGAPTGGGTVNFRPNSVHPSQIYYPCAAHVNMGWNINIGNGLNVEDPSKLKSGLYTVLVTDANGCTVSSQYNISSVTSTLSLSASLINPTCGTSNDGAINLTVSGGTPPITICWDTLNTENGNQFAVTFGPKTLDHPMFGQGSGQGYIVNGVEGKELNLTKGIPYNFNLMTTNHPFRITTDLAGGTTNNVVANGQTGAPAQSGTVTFTPNNTHPSLLYYSCEFHQFMGYNANINEGYCVEDLSNRTAGLYTVTARDANGCSVTAQYNLNAPAPIVLSGAITNASCNSSINGAIDLSISGGNGPYTVCWDTANTENGNQFAVTFAPKTIAHPMFGQGSSQGYVINGVEGKELNLTKGIQYNFNVMTTNHPFRITTDLQGASPNNVVVNGQSGAPTENGIVSFQPDNTHPALLYYSCEFHSFMGFNVNINNGYCTEDITDLKSGAYTVVVTDADGCTATAEYIVTAPDPLILSATITDENCTSRNGSIDLSVSGGVGPYTICWDTLNIENGNQFGVTFGPKTPSHPLFGQGSSQGYIINGIEGKELNLTKGIQYDFNLMTTNHPFRITTDLAGGSPSNVVINGQTGAPAVSGTVSFTPDNSHPPLLYYSCELHQFMGFNVNILNGYCSEDLSNRSAGIYTVTVTDANGCIASASYTVGQVPVVSEICENGIDDDCNGIADDGCPVLLNLRVFIEGYYLSNGQLQPVLYNALLTNDQSICDTIFVELHNAFAPYAIVESIQSLLLTNGTAEVLFPYSVLGNSYYLVIRHRNSIETWSKNPVLFDSFNKSFDFTVE